MGILPMNHGRYARATLLSEPYWGKAGRLLDLYERVWEGQALKDDEFMLSADEKTSFQARARIHTTVPPKPGEAMKVKHE